jgi:hypothetical protein
MKPAATCPTPFPRVTGAQIHSLELARFLTGPASGVDPPPPGRNTAMRGDEVARTRSLICRVQIQIRRLQHRLNATLHAVFTSRRLDDAPHRRHVRRDEPANDIGLRRLAIGHARHVTALGRAAGWTRSRSSAGTDHRRRARPVATSRHDRTRGSARIAGPRPSFACLAI